MDNAKRLTEFLETSFLGPFLNNESITDISFNGSSFFCQDNERGRKPLEITKTKEEVGDFLRQIANFAEKQFSYSSPTLDVSFSRYRLNATFSSVVRMKDEKTFSFSLRIEKEGSLLFKKNDFFPGNSKKIILKAIEERKSIVIAGETGSGKTELQKFILLNLKPCTRVIVIDNIEELELTRGGNLDLTSWLVDERVEGASFTSLIKNALRNNPDYLIVAEGRGGEMMEAIASAMSGHPLIITIHSFDLESIPNRISRMAMMGGKNLIYEDILNDVYENFSYLVFLKKETKNNKVLRYIDKIGLINRKSKTIDVLFSKGNKK